MRCPTLLVAILTLLTACKKAPNKAECRAQGDALTTLLRAAISDPPAVVYPETLKLATRTDIPRNEEPPRGVQVLVGDERPVADQLETGTASQRAARRALFVIGQQTPWRVVVDAFDAAKHHGISEVGFAFAAPAVDLKPPPRSPIDDELDRVMNGPEDNRASRLGELMNEQIARCEPLKKLFGGVGSFEGSRETFLIDGLGESLLACSCDVDIPAFRSLMWRVLANPIPTRVLIVGTEQPATTISAKPEAPWKDVQARLTPGMTSVALTVE